MQLDDCIRKNRQNIGSTTSSNDPPLAWPSILKASTDSELKRRQGRAKASLNLVQNWALDDGVS